MIEREDPLEQITEILKEPVEVGPELTERVMAEIARLDRPVQPPWWRRDWTVRVTPVRGLAVAAGLAVLALAAVLARRPTAAEPEAAAATSSGRLTQFVLVAPEASAVAVVGDFNDWSVAATPLQRAEGDGVWHVSIPLVPGRYRYAFLIDGSVWRRDPAAPGGGTEDEFGRANSVVTVGGAL